MPPEPDRLDNQTLWRGCDVGALPRLPVWAIRSKLVGPQIFPASCDFSCLMVNDESFFIFTRCWTDDHEMKSSGVCYLASLGTDGISALCQEQYDNVDCLGLIQPISHGSGHPALPERITQCGITSVDRNSLYLELVNTALGSSTA